MGRATDRSWVDRANTLFASQPSWSAAQVARALELQESDAGGPAGPPPALRTISSLRKRYSQLPKAEQDSYRYAQWPEVCLSGDLPWAASPALLLLLRFCAEGVGRPPTVNTAKWFWRLWLAADDVGAPIESLVGTAEAVALMERAGKIPDELLRFVQWQLAFKPWTDGGGEYRRVQALRPQLLPPFDEARGESTFEAAPDGWEHEAPTTPRAGVRFESDEAEHGGLNVAEG